MNEPMAQARSDQGLFPLAQRGVPAGLVPGELAVYAYLLYCEDRQTYQCWPSFKTIGRAVGMCVNTVQKYVSMLVRKGLIRAENTSVITRDGQKRNGNLRYTILPIQAAIERYEHLRLEELELETARLRHQQRQNQLPA